MTTPQWTPRDEVEQALAEAAAVGDVQRFFQILTEAPLYLPQVPREPEQYLPERDDQDPDAWMPLTEWVGGEFTVPVFTSVPALRSVTGVQRYEQTSYQALLADGAGLHPRLVVNPGTPIEIGLPLNSISQVLSGDLVLRDGELVAPDGSPPADPNPAPVEALVEPDAARPGHDPERDHRILNDPGAGASHEEYLAALFDARVFVPTTRPARFPNAVPEPEFPWWVTDALGAPTIEVFTSEAGLADAYPELVSTPLPFVLLVSALPDGHGLLVNPQGPVRIRWLPDQIDDLRRRALAL